MARCLAAHPGRTLKDYLDWPNVDARDAGEQEFLDDLFAQWLQDEAPQKIRALFAEELPRN